MLCEGSAVVQGFDECYWNFEKGQLSDPSALDRGTVHLGVHSGASSILDGLRRGELSRVPQQLKRMN